MDGAVTLAQMLGISERVIGLTIVAVGTSLPELATSMIAAFKQQHEISLGNVVGSNVFNTLFVVGGVAAFEPIAFSPTMAQVDLAVMMAFSVGLGVFVLRSERIGRLKGSVALLAYLVYGSYLVFV